MTNMAELENLESICRSKLTKELTEIIETTPTTEPLVLRDRYIPSDINFPKEWQNSIDFRHSKLEEGLALPLIIKGNLYIANCKIPETIKFPSEINGCLVIDEALHEKLKIKGSIFKKIEKFNIFLI